MTNGGFGYVGHVVQLKLADDSFTLRIDGGSSLDPPGVTTDRTRLERSRDRSTISYGVGGGIEGLTFLYHASTDSFTRRKLQFGEVNTVLDQDGSHFLLAGAALYDSAFTKLAQLEGSTDWAALSDDASTVYRVVNRSLHTLQVAPAGIVDRQDVGDTVTNPYHALYVGRIALTSAGDRAVVITDHGLSILPI